MNTTYIVRGGLQKCPTHPAKRMICWVLGLEVEVGLQIGVILQVGASSGSKTKKEPPKQQRTNSIFLSDFQGAKEILLLFLPCLITMYTSHGWVTRLANQLNSTYCEDEPPCILWDGW
jgi:hypothetical protein